MIGRGRAISAALDGCADPQALASALGSEAEAIGDLYDRMLRACDHAGETDGGMQDACYEIEDMYNCACAAAKLAGELDAAAVASARDGKLD